MAIPETPSPLTSIIMSMTYNAAWFSGSTHEAQIQNAINSAAADGALYVFVPASMLPYNASLVTFNSAIRMIREGGDLSVYDPQAYGADNTGATDATAAFNAASLAASVNGGEVYMPPGTYVIGSSVTVYSKVSYRGAGLDATILLAKPNTAVGAVLQGQNFTALTGSGTNGGIYSWQMKDFVIDGNRTNGATGLGVQVYGFNFFVQNVHIRNCTTAGWYSEWGPQSTTSPNIDSMEACLHGVKVWNCLGKGIDFHGPHDSVLMGCEAIINTDIGIHLNGANAAAILVGCHVWGGAATNVPGLQIDSTAQVADSFSEYSGAGTDGFFINAAHCLITNCRANACPGIGYHLSNIAAGCTVDGIATGVGTGLQLDSGAGLFGCRIELNIINPTTTGINFNGGDVGTLHQIIATISKAAGAAVTGSPAAQTSLYLNVQGGATGGRTKLPRGNPLVPDFFGLVYGAAVAVDFSQSNVFRLICTGATQTINNPTNPQVGQEVDFIIENNSGGATVTTWSASYHLAGAWVDPANGKTRCIRFVWDSTGVAYEIARSAADITT